MPVEKYTDLAIGITNIYLDFQYILCKAAKVIVELSIVSSLAELSREGLRGR